MGVEVMVAAVAVFCMIIGTIAWVLYLVGTLATMAENMRVAPLVADVIAE